MDFVEICNVCDRKVIIKAAKRIFNSDKICRSCCDFYFGVTFFGTHCITKQNTRFSMGITVIMPFKMIRHSGSISIPMESLCVISYVWLIATRLVPCTVSTVWQTIGPVFALNRSSLMHSFGVSLKIQYKTHLYHMVWSVFWYLETILGMYQEWQSDILTATAALHYCRAGSSMRLVRLKPQGPDPDRGLDRPVQRTFRK